ncbi:hypothetical protein A2W24_00840 [Microgenomates group bacterium RBG_16_45_19]|nr:MAG: hypothetical protein A2W24_00840 [Microgenomates group bacterium RBG_16_45_19]
MVKKSLSGRQSQPWLVVLGCLGLALGLRLYQFGAIPHGLNRDEAAIGYTAQLLAMTGREEHGRRWPLKFESFGDWKQPLYIYLTIPWILIFGLTPAAVRSVSLISGLAMMMAALLTTNQLWGAKTKWGWPGWVAFVLLAVNPWHFHFSRLALEAMLAASLFSLGGLSLIKRRLWLGVGILILSMGTYHGALIVIPLWFLGFLFSQRPLRKNRALIIAALGLYLATLVMGYQTWFSGERAKVTGTVIFNLSPAEQWQQIYQYRTNQLGSKLKYNQYVYYGQVLVKNYLRTWTPEFLLVKGGNHPHYNVPYFGNFLGVEITLAIFGIFWIIKQKNRNGWLVLWALILGPLPAALTLPGIHSTRSVLMLPWVQVIGALGAGYLVSRVKSRGKMVLIAGLGLLLGLQAFAFFNYYYGPYRTESDWRFDGYMKEVAEYLKDNRGKYQKIYVTFPFESPYIFYAFYNRLQPQEFLNSVDYYQADTLGFRHVKSLLNMEYVSKFDQTKLDQKVTRVLVVSRIEEAPGVKPLTTFTNLDGKVEMVAYEPDDL